MLNAGNLMYCGCCRALLRRSVLTHVQELEAVRLVCNTPVRWFNEKVKSGYGGWWRFKEGEAVNKTRYGPLTDLPDFTFLDGRRTPMTPAQAKRKEARKEIGTRILKLLKDVDQIKPAPKSRKVGTQTHKSELKSENKRRPHAED